MAPLLESEYTSFTLDTMGRYLCNTLEEALTSTTSGPTGLRRDFDVIIVGGGTFGSVIASALLNRDPTRSRRMLVLEEGPFVLPEHVQNLPFMGGTPNWRVPWMSAPGLNFTGLQYAVGGRSLSWGGWSPELLNDGANDEMRDWPAGVKANLASRYFQEAAEQIGVATTNDFIYGPLHEVLRRQLHDGVTAAGAGSPLAPLPLGTLPNHPAVRRYIKQHGTPPTDAQLRDWLNLPTTDTTPRAELLNLLKLEAPLAVQAVTLPGLFPFNKFSAVPLLTRAARIAATEANGTGPEADSRKRLFVVPKCHVVDLLTTTQVDGWVRVVGVRAVDGNTGTWHEIPLAQNASGGGESVVIIALGTIESTRLALQTFKDSLAGRAAARMGKNHMAHLRSNLTIRLPRSALAGLPPAVRSLQTSALLVKGKANIRGTDRYFHLQITASGLSTMGADSEAELFKKIPDLDQIDKLLRADDQSVVVTIRGIGEMAPQNPDSKVELAQFDSDVWGRPLAWVEIGDARAASGGSQQTQDDRDLWRAMDDASDEVAIIFASGQPFEILNAKGGKTVPVPAGATAADFRTLHPHVDRWDFLGTTHHEAGTLWMSDDPATGVTNEFGRIHDITNCYVVGPALCPTSGSPNPMLTGVALGRRTADMLSSSVLRRPAPFVAAPGFTSLFDGTAASFAHWSRTSPNTSNGFTLVDGEILTNGGRDFGLLYYAASVFVDFTLRLQFRIFDTQNHNSGVFVRFRDPLGEPTPVILARIVAEGDDHQKNRAWTAVHSGFEIQIDDHARGDRRKDFYGIPEPDGLRKNRTGAIYKIPARDFIPHLSRDDAEMQVYQPGPPLRPGVWYEYEIDVRGDQYTVDLTDLDTALRVRTSTFQNSDPDRGIALEGGQPAGLIGIQSYANAPVAFRHIQVSP